MEKVRPWCGQPSDRGRLKNRTGGWLPGHSRDLSRHEPSPLNSSTPFPSYFRARTKYRPYVLNDSTASCYLTTILPVRASLEIWLSSRDEVAWK